MLAVRPGEGAAIVAGARGVGVEDLAEAVRAGIGRARRGRPATTAASAVKPRIDSGRMRMASIAILTSFASIFLPRYSGVRPTISPATNTATIAKSSMP